MMANRHPSIPRPLVRTNQWVIVICVAASWITGLYALLLLPLIAGLLGAAFNYNPVIRWARPFLRKPLTEYIPEDASQQKFNQSIATVLLLCGFISFAVGWTTAGYVFTIMVAVAAVVAILGFCVGCFILYQWSQYRYRKTQRG